MFSVSTHLEEPPHPSPNIQLQQQQHTEQQYATFGSPSTATAGLSDAETEQDPFLQLLEQLAENEHSRGGLSELDYLLSSGG
jgi:hypothetical protein